MKFDKQETAMRIHEKMKVRTVAGENIVVMPDGGDTDMTKVVALNASALLLYNALQGRDFELEEAAQILADQYSISGTQALSDARAWVDDMKRNGLIVG
jgi:hypothetical protein